MLGSFDSSLSSSNKSKSHPLSQFLDYISSYDGNGMLAAVVSLLLVILFVLLLHIYAKWFLAQARRRRSRSSMSVSQVLRPPRFHHFHTFAFDDNSNDNDNVPSLASSSLKGLEDSAIASIPLFVYTSSEYKQGLECVICLSAFEDKEVGRSLPKCGHCFHVECIDMWLHSHSNCPICRAPVVGEKKIDVVIDSVENNSENNSLTEAAAAELLDVVVEGVESRLERVSDATNCENSQNEVRFFDISSLSPSSSSSLGSSLKRMLSRNRSECKVFPSSTVTTNEIDA